MSVKGYIDTHYEVYNNNINKTIKIFINRIIEARRK